MQENLKLEGTNALQMPVHEQTADTDLTVAI